MHNVHLITAHSLNETLEWQLGNQQLPSSKAQAALEIVQTMRKG